MEKLATDIFLQRHPLKFVGCQMGRVVTLIRLASGKLVIHSTAKFSDGDVAQIAEIGEPAWLLEANRFHDTCAKAGREAFPGLPYLSPDRRTLPEIPEEWDGELEVMEIGGMPKLREQVVFHRPSKTLVVADLMFNLPSEAGWWTHAFLRYGSGIREYPGMSRLFRMMIKDRAAFIGSMQRIAAWDFERIVVAHGDPVTERAKARFLTMLAGCGFHLDP